MRFPAALRAYAADARTAFRHAPVEVALGVLLALTLSVQLRNASPDTWEAWMRFAAGAWLALPVVFAASALRFRGAVSTPARWGITAAALALAFGYSAVVMDLEKEAEGWRLVLLGALSLSLLLLAPAFPRGGERRRVWGFDARGVMRVIGVLVYGALLYGALAGAVAAVVNLFDLDRPAHLYEDLGAWIFYALVPWIAVGGLPRLVEGEDELPPLGLLAGRLLYVPVLVLYLAILYAYVAKVLVTGEVPKNLLSPLVIAAGGLGFLGGLLLDPVHRDGRAPGLAKLIRVFPALLLPLLPLAGWAILQRLGQYGWTEFRYLRMAAVAVLAVLAVLGTVRLARRRPPLLTAVLLAMAVTAALAAIGPWSATAVSRESQLDRLRSGLRAAGLTPEQARTRLKGGADTLRVDSAAYSTITGSARYLYQSHGPASLRPVLGEVPDTVKHGWDVARALRIMQACAPQGQLTVDGARDWRPGVPLPVGGRLYQVGGAVHEDGPVPPPPTRDRTGPPVPTTFLRIDGDSATVRLPGGAGEAGVDLRPLRASLLAAARRTCDSPNFASVHFGGGSGVFPLRDAAGRDVGRLVVTALRFREGTDRPPPWLREEKRGRWRPTRPGIYSVEAMLLVAP